MAHHEDRFCQRRPWSNFIREVGSGGGGGENCDDRPAGPARPPPPHNRVDPETYQFLCYLQGDFFLRPRVFT
jgi:hypothetical protein